MSEFDSQPDPETPEIAERNLEQLLGKSYRPEGPDAEFIARLTAQMQDAAGGTAGLSSSEGAGGANRHSRAGGNPGDGRSTHEDIAEKSAGGNTAGQASSATQDEEREPLPTGLKVALAASLLLGGFFWWQSADDGGTDNRVVPGKRGIVWVDGKAYVRAGTAGENRPADPFQLGLIRLDVADTPVGYERLVARDRAPVETPAPLAAGQSLQTGRGEKRRATLADGSVLFVNAATALTVDAERTVTLTSGEIYVQVAPRAAHDDEAAFTVRTPTREVQALGTRFAVRADARQTDVTVTQGKVRVSGYEQLVYAGQQLKLAGEESALTAAPRASHLLAWTEDLVTAAEGALVPASEYGGGALVTIDPNGQESRLSLRKIHVDVHIEDGFARTTIDQTYFNHMTSRQEGTFYFPVPPDASLSRLAMYVGSKRMEGGMVERDYGRNVFEEIVTRQKDPALLEWVDGSTFKMRVFPLEPREEKRIILSYTQRLTSSYGRTAYRFAAGHNMDVVGKWSAQIRVVDGAGQHWACPSHELTTAEKKDGDLLLTAAAAAIKPDRDIVLALGNTGSDGGRQTDQPRWSSAVQDVPNEPGYRYLMLRYRPQLASRPKLERRDWVFLFESSGDRDPLLARVQVDVIRTLLENAQRDDTFSIVTAATRVSALSPEPRPCTPENIAAAVRQLEQTHLVGALDLRQGLAAAGMFCEQVDNPYLVHVGSGVPILGERAEERLVAGLPRARYVGIGVGKRWNRGLMRSAAAKTGGHYTQINPDEPVAWRSYELLATLNAPRLLNVSLEDGEDKARFLLFDTALAQGEELCAVARLPRNGRLPRRVTLRGTLDGKAYREELRVADVSPRADYLPRTWTKLEIDRLVADSAAEHKDRIVKLSKAMYVISPFTSLLVLENEAMYEQYKVDRGRQDHWEMYPAPDEIQVVREPLVGPVTQPVPTPDPKTTEPKQPDPPQTEPKKTASDVLETIVVRGQRYDTPYVISVLPDPGVGRVATWAEQDVPFQVFGNVLHDAAWIQGRFGEGTYTGMPRSGIGGGFGGGFGRGFSGMQSLGESNADFDALIDLITSTVSPQVWDEVEGRGVPVDLSLVISQTQQVHEAPLGLPHLGRFEADNLEDYLLGRIEGRTGRDFYTATEWDDPVGLRRIINMEKRRVLGEHGFSELDQMRRPEGSLYVDRYDPRLRFTETMAFHDKRITDQNLDWNLRKFLALREARHRNYASGLMTVENAGIPLPSPYYMQDDVQFFAPGPEFKLQREAQSMFQFGDIPHAFQGRGAWRTLKQHDALDWKRDNFWQMNTFFRQGGPISYRTLPLNRPYGNGRFWMRGVVDEHYPGSLTAGVWSDAHDRLGTAILTNGDFAGEDVNGRVSELLRRVVLSDNSRSMELGWPDYNPTVIERAQVELQNAADAASLAAVLELKESGQSVDGGFHYTPPRTSGHQAVYYDLLDYAPGMRTTAADVQALIEAETGDATEPGTIDPAAAELIRAARGAGFRQAKFPGGFAVTFDGTGRFRYQRSTAEGLVEVVAADGSTLWHTYDEIGLGARRPLSRFHRRELAAALPWFLPPAKELARGCDLLQVEPRVVAIVPQGARQQDAPYLSVELKFAVDGRLMERRLVLGPDRRKLLTLTLSPRGMLRWFNRHGRLLGEVAATLADAGAPNLQPASDELVVLPFPVRRFVQVTAGTKFAETGSFDDIGQLDDATAMALLANYVWRGDSGTFEFLARRFFARGDRRLGFYTLLASRWGSWSRDQTYGGQTYKFDPLADHPQQSLARYLDWVSKHVHGQPADSTGFGPLLSQLAQFHNVMLDHQQGKWNPGNVEARWRAIEFAADKQTAPWMSWLVAVEFAQLGEATFARDLAQVFERFVDLPGWAFYARYERARMLSRFDPNGWREFDKWFRQCLDAGLLPPVDREFGDAYQQQSKSEELQALFRTAAEQLTERYGPLAAAPVAWQCRALGQIELGSEIVTASLSQRNDRNRLLVTLAAVNYLDQVGRHPQAQRLVDQLLTLPRYREWPNLWRLSGRLARDQGYISRATAAEERAMDLEFAALGDLVNLQRLRENYTALFDHYAELARALASPEGRPSAEFVARVVRAADRWRSLDDDATRACQSAAKVLQDAGAAELAWDYVTTPLADQPNEAAPWQSLARALRADEQVDLADRAYRLAYEMEPTNADILWEHAEFLDQQGRSTAARDLHLKLIEGQWQPRFQGVQQRARVILGK